MAGKRGGTGSIRTKGTSSGPKGNPASRAIGKRIRGKGTITGGMAAKSGTKLPDKRGT